MTKSTLNYVTILYIWTCSSQEARVFHMPSAVCVFVVYVVSIVRNLIYQTAVLFGQTFFRGMKCQWLGTRLPQALYMGGKMKLVVYTLA